MTTAEEALLERFGWAADKSRDPVEIHHTKTGDLATGEAVKGVLYWLAAAEEGRRRGEWYANLPG